MCSENHRWALSESLVTKNCDPEGEIFRSYTDSSNGLFLMHHKILQIYIKIGATKNS